MRVWVKCASSAACLRVNRVNDKVLGGIMQGITTIWRLALLLVSMFISTQANAGHLFTQAQTNTPISLTAGQGIQVTQLTYEGGGSNGLVTVNFSGGADNAAWSAGDAIQLTIGSWSETFTFDGMVAAGGSQSGTAFSITSSSLTAAGISPSGTVQWTVVATAGTFTFEGYRIYTVGNTFNGTGAGLINQSQVVNASQLGGGGTGVFVPVAESNENELAEVLEQLNGTATGQLGAVIDTMEAMTDESRTLAMKLISPERSQVLGQSAVSTASTALDTVQVRLDAVRTGVGMESMHANHASMGHGGDAQSGMSSGDEGLNRSFWLKAFGGKADQDAKGGFAGSDSDIYGLMAGADRITEGGWLTGLAFAYARTDVDMTDYRDGDGADIDTYQLTGYFGKSFARWYLDGMLTYAYQRYDTSRNTHLTGVAKGDFHGDLYGLRLIAGVPIPLSDVLTLTPFGGVEAHHIRQSSYTEKGAGVLSLDVSSNETDRIRSIVGTELGAMKKLADGSVLRPALKFSWRHEFHDDGVSSTTSLVGGGGQFETTGQDVNSDVYGLSARVNWEKTERLSFSFELGAESGEGYDSISGQVAGSWRF